jgi:hypothetical protein
MRLQISMPSYKFLQGARRDDDLCRVTLRRERRKAMLTVRFAAAWIASSLLVWLLPFRYTSAQTVPAPKEIEKTVVDEKRWRTFTAARR